MHRLAVLLISFWVFAALGCGAPPDEPVDQTSAALNGVSTPPAGGWGTEPWLCSGGAWINGHTPMNTAWPAHGWCQWQPSPTAGILPYHVADCSLSPDPIWPGTAYLYSGDSFTGSCAAAWASNFPAPAYQFDSDLVQANGWLSIWTPPGGFQQTVSIRSIKVGPHTAISMCPAPFDSVGSTPCHTAGGWSLTSGPVPVGYAPAPVAFAAAIQLQSLR